MSKTIDLLFCVLIGSLFIQISVYQSATSSNTLLLYHLLLAGLFVMTIPRKQRLRVSPDTLFFAVMATTSLLGWAVYGLTLRAVLLPIAFLAFTAGNRWQERTSREARLKVYQGVFVAVVVAIVIRNLVYYDSLGVIYARIRAETPVFFLASGGPNLEATQLGMLATLLIGTAAFLPAIAIAAITSALMLSRAGLLAVLIALMFWLIQGKFDKGKLYAGGLAIATAMILIIISIEGTYKVPILDRFDVSAEQSLAADDQGRLAMWRTAGTVLSENPLGHGTGNGFTVLNEQIGGHLRENNTHNVLVEFALDGGIQSSILFVVVMISILRAPGMVHAPCHRFAIAYGLLGLFEYTGYDAIGWFFIGISHANRFNFREE